MALDSTSPISVADQQEQSPNTTGRAEPTPVPGPIPAPRSNERRREARHQTNEQAEVEFPDGQSVAAIVRDISRTGLTLELRTSVARGMAIKIKLAGSVVILGDVVNCRHAGMVHRAGLAIRSMSFPHCQPEQHCGDEQMGFHLVGMGLTVVEVISLRDHLKDCSRCRARLAELRDHSLRKLAKDVLSTRADQRRFRRSGAKREIRVTTACGQAGEAEARIVEISETGLSFIGGQYFDPQAELQIEFDDCRLLALVKHCRERQYAADTEFMTGVKIQSILEGSETWEAMVQSVG
jgi:hypothetical protein